MPLQMGGVGDFRYYDEFDLWGGPRGDLTTHANRDEHVRKVFDVQDSLGAPHLAPTVLAPRAVQGRRRPPAFLRNAATNEETDGWWTFGYVERCRCRRRSHPCRAPVRSLAWTSGARADPSV